jgi:cell division transport system permease protein
MQKKGSSFNKIATSTKKHIVRNQWLSFASVIVFALTFLISLTFLGLVIISNRTIKTFEQKAQILLFFEPATEEDDIFAIQEKLEKTDLFEEIEYVSQEEALQIYIKDFEDDPALVESVTADALPPYLGLRANDINDIPEIIETATEIQKEHPELEDIMYFQDVIDSLRSISRVIRIGGTALVLAMTIVSILLILITIGFNINSHKHEIDVMQLVGSTDSYIRTPYLLEGTIYGTLGSGIAIGILLLLWYSGIYILKQGDMYIFVTQTFQDIDMPYLMEFDIVFASLVSLASLAVGALVGFFSSSLAIWRYLK